MNNDKYELELVSMERGHKGKALKKYALDNELETVGVYENEPFMIRFRNKTFKKIQVKISVDGTDILSGEPATTNLDGSKSWVVNGYDVLELKAWPEDNDGGAEFIFGQSKNSVAGNTHGDMSGRGIVAVAVFEESFVPEVYSPMWNDNSIRIGGWKGNSNPSFNGMGIIYDSCNVDRSLGADSDYTISSSVDSINTQSFEKSSTRSMSRKRRAAPAVGAGNQVEQKIGTASGLIEPELAEVVQLKYDWWSNLRTKIRKFAKEQEVKYAGFPGDKVNIDLSNVPRMETEEPRPKKRRVRRKRFGKRKTSPENKYKEYSRFI